MSFFRRKLKTNPLTARLVTGMDRAELTRLIHAAERRFLTSSIAELPRILAADPTAVLELDGRTVGLMSFGWRAAPVAWLRSLALYGEVPPLEGLRLLGRPIYDALRGDGITLTAVTLDDWGQPWLRRPLLQLGYRPMVEVVGYEKTRLDRPAHGNELVGVRAATDADLATVIALDRACFPLPWVKGTEVFETSLQGSPCFLIAEFSGEAVGYAFVTAHHGGHLYHLVRIAVRPTFQGRGIGVRLLAEVVDFCAARNADVLTLNTQADNYTAQRLYEWFGFRRTGERQTVLGLDIATA
jgi:[ribosomal protein S18]-alanine N-acetyltransferase